MSLSLIQTHTNAYVWPKNWYFGLLSYGIFQLFLQPPPVVTIVLKIRMHCDACAQVIQKRIRKIKGTKIRSSFNLVAIIDCFCILSPCHMWYTQQTRLNNCKIIELFSCTLFFFVILFTLNIWESFQCFSCNLLTNIDHMLSIFYFIFILNYSIIEKMVLRLIYFRSEGN